MPAEAEVPPSQVQSVTVGPQRLRVAVRPGRPNGAGHPPRPPLLLINGIGARLEALEPFAAALDAAVEANARLMHRLVPDSRLHVYPGGHLGLITEAATLAPVVDGFLAGP
jgi:hypothetical protein